MILVSVLYEIHLSLIETMKAESQSKSEIIEKTLAKKLTESLLLSNPT